MTFKQLPICCFIGNCASKKEIFFHHPHKPSDRAAALSCFFSLPQERYIPGTDWNKQPRFSTSYTQGLAKRGYHVSAPESLWKRQNGASFTFAPFCISSYKLSRITVGKSPHKTTCNTRINIGRPARAFGFVCRLI